MENPNNIVDFDYCLLKQHIALFVLNSLLLINNIIGNYYYYVGKTNSSRCSKLPLCISVMSEML